MTIVFTGGGSGGHFYPIIAIAEAVADVVRERRLIPPKLYYLAPEPYDEKALFDNGIAYIKISAGKVRRYFSIENFTGFIATALGTIGALMTLIRIYPDVVVGKGGFGSVPTILAARILNIPIVIHESDSKPGRASLFAAPFARKIAISYDSSLQYFPKSTQSKIARTGIPIRKALTRIETEGARQYLGLEEGVPTVLFLGGSQGSQKINETLLACLTDLLGFANVIHQTGTAHYTGVVGVAKVILAKSQYIKRYHPFSYLAELSLQRVAAVTDLVVARAGSTTIAEIALWKKPVILIPIPENVSHDQRGNAYAFAATGAGTVIEEENLTPHLLLSEIQRIVTNPALMLEMGSKSAGFSDPDAAKIIAEQILAIALEHEA